MSRRMGSIGDARPSLHERCMFDSHYHISPANRCAGRYSGRLQLAIPATISLWMAITCRRMAFHIGISDN